MIALFQGKPGARRFVLPLLLAGAAVAGIWLLERGAGGPPEDTAPLPRPWVEPPQLGEAPSPREPGSAAPVPEFVEQRFQQAVVMLHARRYEFAVAALEQVLEHQPRMPEAHVNMGYARLGAGDVAGAAEHFGQAIDLRPAQANAYYGLAEALEALGDLPGAVGAMRTFVHLSDPEDPFLPRARAALWEWRQRMEAGSGPPPGDG